MLKQAFGQDKGLQEEVELLSNIFNNRLNDFVNSSDKEDIISRYQNRKVTSLWLLATGKNRVTSNSEIEEEAIARNRITSYSKIEVETEDANEDIFDINFFYWRIIKYNW